MDEELAQASMVQEEYTSGETLMKWLVPIAAAMLLSACATNPRVNTDHDVNANFAAYHNYTWVSTTPQPGINPLLHERIKAAVDAELALKGFQKSDSPDFAVAITLGARDRVETTDLGPYRPFYPGYGLGVRTGWAHVYTETEVRTVTDGTLTIDIFDARTRQPVWHGRATQRIGSQAISNDTVNRAVSSVLEDFPPTR
jgi:hypothetical protein